MPSHVRRRKRVVEAGVENAEGEWRGAYEDIPTRARTRSPRAPKPCTHARRLGTLRLSTQKRKPSCHVCGCGHGAGGTDVRDDIAMRRLLARLRQAAARIL